MSEILTVEKQDHFELWTLNRPESLNAFNKALLVALGTGRAFSAGADLKERKSMPAADVPAFVNLIGGTFQRIAECEVPFIAAIDGFAFGGGLEVALACDIRSVGPAAKMGLTETRLAIVPGAGGTQRLPRLIGVGRAKEMILSGRRIDADEAIRIGLAELDGRTSDAMTAALQCARDISSCGPIAVRAANAAIEGALGQPLNEGLRHERRCYDRTLDTSDRLEALTAFAEKRPPVFKGQ